MNAPGKGILKVVSILYIVCGSLWALLALGCLALGATMGPTIGAMLADYLPMGYASLIGAGVGILLFIIFLFVAAVDLVFGIIGVKKAGKPSASLFFIITGFILGGLTLIGMLQNFTIPGMIMLVMPVLFIVGGFMNNKAKAA